MAAPGRPRVRGGDAWALLRHVLLAASPCCMSVRVIVGEYPTSNSEAGGGGRTGAARSQGFSELEFVMTGVLGRKQKQQQREVTVMSATRSRLCVLVVFRWIRSPLQPPQTGRGAHEGAEAGGGQRAAQGMRAVSSASVPVARPPVFPRYAGWNVPITQVSCPFEKKD